MINFTLYKREMKNSWKLCVILIAVLTMYIALIIGMYNSEMQDSLNEIVELMPGIMTALGMSANAATLMSFMASYLYGMLLIVFPMVFSIIRGNALIAKYVDRGSMVALLAAPMKRSVIAFTQMIVLGTCLFAFIAYTTVIQIVVAQAYFPGALETGKLLFLNAGLLCLQLFIGGICFFASCLFSDANHSVAFGAGIPTLMYIVQMLANMGGKLEKAKYFTFLTLFNPNGILAGECAAIAGIPLLLICAIVLFAAGIMIFNRKDLHI